MNTSNVTQQQISQSTPVESNRSDEVSFQEMFFKFREWGLYLFSKWILILIACIIGGMFGLLYAYSKKSLYTAELTFVLEGGNQGNGLGSYAGLASQFGINMGEEGQGVFEGENFITFMRSRLMVEKALMNIVNVDNKNITLAEFYIEINKLRQRWAKENSELMNVRFLSVDNPSKFSLEQNKLISSFHKTLIKNNLFIDKQDKKSGILTLRVKSENELFSKYFAEILVKEASEFYKETKTKKSAENLRILQYQTDSIRRALNSSMVGAAVSTDANPNPNPARQILRVPSLRKQGDVQANQAMLIQLVQNLEIAKISLRTETPLIQVIDSPVLPLEETATSKLTSLIMGSLISVLILSVFLVCKKLFK